MDPEVPARERVDSAAEGMEGAAAALLHACPRGRRPAPSRGRGGRGAGDRRDAAPPEEAQRHHDGALPTGRSAPRTPRRRIGRGPGDRRRRQRPGRPAAAVGRGRARPAARGVAERGGRGAGGRGAGTSRRRGRRGRIRSEAEAAAAAAARASPGRGDPARDRGRSTRRPLSIAQATPMPRPGCARPRAGVDELREAAEQEAGPAPGRRREGGRGRTGRGGGRRTPGAGRRRRAAVPGPRRGGGRAGRAAEQTAWAKGTVDAVLYTAAVEAQAIRRAGHADAAGYLRNARRRIQSVLARLTDRLRAEVAEADREAGELQEAAAPRSLPPSRKRPSAGPGRGRGAGHARSRRGRRGRPDRARRAP